jgi:hypothetical protein
MLLQTQNRMELTSISRRKRAFTAIELMFIVVLILFLIVLLLPWLSANIGLRARAERQKCFNIQRSMSLGFRVFANDNGEKFPFAVSNSLAFGNESEAWVHFQTMSNELGSARVLMCPADRERLKNLRTDFGAGSTGLGSAGNAAVSYGVGLDADGTLPKTILLLDRNIVTNSFNWDGKIFLAASNHPPPQWDARLHKHCGNFALADGSVQQASNAGLASQVRNQGIATNRLLLPLLR